MPEWVVIVTAFVILFVAFIAFAAGIFVLDKVLMDRSKKQPPSKKP